MRVRDVLFASSVAVTIAGVGIAVPSGTSWAQPARPPCDAWDVDYAVAGRLQLSDTPLGQGDGVHSVGPGTMTIRFEDRGGRPGGKAKMISYEVPQAFTVSAKTIFGTTNVRTDATTRKIPDACGAPPEGTLTGAVLSWERAVPGFETVGTLTCDGAFCGQFGAPPRGQSALHVGPNPVQFQPLRYAEDLSTFTMASTFVSKTEKPKQTAHLTLSGREVRRACAPVKACGP